MICPRSQWKSTRKGGYWSRRHSPLPTAASRLGQQENIAPQSALKELLSGARKLRDADCTVTLTTVEWQALMAFTTKSATPPEAPPTLREAVRAIAKLGGFIGRKSDGEPGVKGLWRGWLRLQDIVETWTLTHPPKDVGNA